MNQASKNNSRRSIWLVIVLAPCLILAGGGGWLLSSESGLQWLVSVIERQSGGKVNANGISGTLLDTLGMQQLEVHGDGWRITLQDIELNYQPSALLKGELRVLQLSARQVDILSISSGKPLTLPENLTIPIAVKVMQMKLGSLSFSSSEGAAPDFSVKDIEANLEADSKQFQLHSLSTRLPFGDLSGSGEISFSRPYKIKVQASLEAETNVDQRSLNAHLVAEAKGDLEHISIQLDGKGEGIEASGHAQFSPFTTVPIDRMQMSFTGMEASRLFEGAPLVVLSGQVDLRGLPGGELEGSMQLQNAHAESYDRKGLPLKGITTQIRLSSSRIQLDQIDVNLLNEGHITGAVSWEGLRNKLSAQLILRDVDPAVFDSRLSRTKLNGNVAIEGLNEEQKANISLSDGKLNLEGEIIRHGALLELSSVRLKQGESELTGHGQLVMDRRRSFRFSTRLHKLNLSDYAEIPSTDLNANLEVSGTLLPEVQGDMQFNLFDSNFAQNSIKANGQLKFSGLKRAEGNVELYMGDNHFILEVAHGIQDELAKLVVEATNLEQFGNGFGGQVTGVALLSGSLAMPRLQFSALGSNLLLPGGHRLASLDATGDMASAWMSIKLGITDYQGTSGFRIPQASAELQGSRENHALVLNANISQSGDALGYLSLKASGGLGDITQGWSDFRWRGMLDELDAKGVLPFQLVNATPLSFAKDSISLDAAEVAILGGNIQFSEIQWTPQRWNTSGNFTGLNIRAINKQSTVLLSDAFDSMRIGGNWDITANDHWQGYLQLQRESGDWVVNSKTGLRLGLDDLKLTIRAEQNQLHGQLFAKGEHINEVFAQANVSLSHSEDGWTILPDAPLSGHLRLRSDDLSWLGPLLNSNFQSSGKLDLDVDLVGTLISPRLKGKAQGEALSLSFLDQGIRMEQGELKTRFDSDVVYVDRLAFSAPYQPPTLVKRFADYTFPAGIGTLSATGRIDLEGGSGDLQINADHLPLLQRPDRWLIASGTGHARYTNNALLLGGNIRVDAGLINQPVSDRPSLPDDVEFIGQEDVKRSGPPNSVDATLDLGDHFYIRASGLEGRLAGQLAVRGEPGEPLRVTGIIAAQDSVFDAYGQRLQVERGIVNFQGPLDDPGLNILALRKGLDVEAGVEVTGTVRRPKVRLVSTPNVPDGEKLSWIILGRVPETDGVDTALLLAAASSILGGQSSGQIGRTLGVDEISLRQETGEDAQLVNKVTVGKQLSARTRISYEQSLSETSGVTKFTYTLTPRITIVTRAGTEDALDVFYTFRFY